MSGYEGGPSGGDDFDDYGDYEDRSAKDDFEDDLGGLDGVGIPEVDVGFGEDPPDSGGAATGDDRRGARFGGSGKAASRGRAAEARRRPGDGLSWAVGGLDSSGRRVTRVAIIGVIVALVLLAAFADRSPARTTVADAGATNTAMPLSAPGRAISTSWFCAGPVGSPAHLAAGSLVIANAASRSLAGTVSFVGSAGAMSSRDVHVAPGSSTTVMEPTVAANAFLGAIVDLDGGQAAVQQVISGTEGSSSMACATAGSGAWYFPAGTTQENSSLSLMLLNPFPEDAIADLSFTTNQGAEDPADFQGLVVPGGTLLGVDLGGHLRDRSAVATSVHLRVGRLVAFETQIVQAQTSSQQQVAGAGAWPPGLDLTLGTPSPGTEWWWPSGVDGSGETEEYVLYNPTGSVAQVSLGAALDQGSAEPFQVTVQPDTVSVVTTNSESRIPMGVGHAAWLKSRNGVGVVATRLVMSAASAPSPGITAVLGSRLTAASWLVPGDAAASAENASVVVYNPGPKATTVSITPFGASDRRQVTIGPGRRNVLSLGSTDPVLVAGPAGAQLVVEADTTVVHGVGLDSALGVPLSS
ncbi:MAG: DUF5719 family protein [Acidimicrobiales bacterium]